VAEIKNIAETLHRARLLSEKWDAKLAFSELAPEVHLMDNIPTFDTCFLGKN